jgi:hypothetical protein
LKLNKVSNLKGKIYRIKILLIFFVLVLVTGASGEDIIENEVEDINILTSQVFGTEPNVLFVYDSSYSMGTNFGGGQVGNWDNEDTVTTCLKSNHQNVNTNYAKAHCMGNAAGTNPCGSIACTGSRSGTCELPDDFTNFLECMESSVNPVTLSAGWYADPNGDGNASDSLVSTIYSTVVSNACGGSSNDPRIECTTDIERAHAAAAMETFALKKANAVSPATFLLNCGASNCALTENADKSCASTTEFNNFQTCMQSNRIQPTATTCTNGKNCSQGKWGSSRLDAVISSFFDLLDADETDGNSMSDYMCTDPNRLFDGVNSTINCRDWLNTPFRNVGPMTSTQSGAIPTTSGSKKVVDLININDQKALGLRIRPITYGGSGASMSGNSSCTGNSLIRGPQGGFAGGSQLNIDNVWKFFRDIKPDGRSMLAGAIGFDDNYRTNSTYGDDALRDFELQLKTGKESSSCSANFALIITDGQDNCSGDGAVLPGSAEGSSNFPPVTGNANRRSAIQAVSNLRTHFVRNDLNDGEEANVEVISFVICLGVRDLKSTRVCNAMALGGGSHTTGILRHTNPQVNEIGGVDLNSVLPGSGSEGLRNFGLALGVDSGDGQLQGCLTPNESSGACSFGGFTLFDNDFFNNPESGPLDFTTPGTVGSPGPNTSFAFFVDSPEGLSNAIETILGFIETFPTSGVAPTAPQSSASLAVRDRIFLSLIRPIADKRLWQGRLALYAFVDDPSNPGSRIIIRKPDQGADLSQQSVVDANAIFDEAGLLNSNAKQFFWEAGKNLAELNLSDPNQARRLFTVRRTDTGTKDVELNGTEVLRVRYEGERTDFNLANSLLNLAEFGIGDADVTDPIADYCKTEPPGGISNCSADCLDSNGDSLLPFTGDCKACVKNCIRDKIIDYMSGNTIIETREDPLGDPSFDPCPTDTFEIGCDCPDFEEDPPTGSFDQCSVRLGDVFHSVPVLVGSPSPLFFDAGFHAFAVEFRDRSAAVYVGANDGFLHAFHAGDLVNASSDSPQVNPFNNRSQTIPFFNAGSGRELFAFAPPSYLPDSISQNDPESPSGFTSDFRFGDFKTFIAEKNEERSFFDGSPLVADIFIDGYPNGIDEDASTCPGTISAPDGNIDLCGREWHTLLISGYRNGGGAYTVLDVTNVKCAGNDNPGPQDQECSSIEVQEGSGNEYPRHLWTAFDKDFGNTWSEPTVGRVRMMASDGGTDVTVDRWVMFVGGGMDPLDTDPTDGVTFGNAFYAIDIPTGKIIFKFNPDDPIPSSLSDTDLADMECDMSARVGAFDLNADGYMDVAYAGDTCGRLWRFDISLPIVADDLSQTGLRGDADITAPDWTGDIAFCATADINQCLDPSTIPVDPITFVSQRMPIFFAPSAVFDDLGNLHVIFTTGNRRNPSSTSQFGRLYNFIDSFVPAFLAGGAAVPAATKTEADFDAGQVIDIVPLAGVADQFTTEGGSTVNNQGEFIVRFPDNVDTSGENNVESPSGEKGFGTPVVIERVLIFTTFAPDADTGNACTAGTGEGRVFALDYLSGEPALVRVPGAQGLLSGSDIQKQATSGKTVGPGMPTPTQLTFGARGSVIMTVAFSGSAEAGGGVNFLVLELPQLPTRTQTLFWEELL